MYIQTLTSTAQINSTKNAAKTNCLSSSYNVPVAYTQWRKLYVSQTNTLYAPIKANDVANFGIASENKANLLQQIRWFQNF